MARWWWRRIPSTSRHRWWQLVLDSCRPHIFPVHLQAHTCTKQVALGHGPQLQHACNARYVEWEGGYGQTGAKVFSPHYVSQPHVLTCPSISDHDQCTIIMSTFSYPSLPPCLLCLLDRNEETIKCSQRVRTWERKRDERAIVLISLHIYQ